MIASFRVILYSSSLNPGYFQGQDVLQNPADIICFKDCQDAELGSGCQVILLSVANFPNIRHRLNLLSTEHCFSRVISGHFVLQVPKGHWIIENEKYLQQSFSNNYQTRRPCAWRQEWANWYCHNATQPKSSSSSKDDFISSHSADVRLPSVWHTIRKKEAPAVWLIAGEQFNLLSTLAHGQLPLRSLSAQWRALHIVKLPKSILL